MRKFLLPILLCVCFGHAQTIAEKMASSNDGGQSKEMEIELLSQAVNQQLVQLRTSLSEHYDLARILQEKGAQEGEFFQLLRGVNQIKEQMKDLEERWRQTSVDESKRGEEGYALWDQEETTLGQLITEFGALDYLYIVPPEMAMTKLNMHSNVPIPREAWGDVLEIILAHNGIGVKKVNSYARQLYVLKQDPSAIQHIASSPEDLLWLADHARLFYLFSPPPEQVKSVFQFFERFADAKQTFIYQVGPKIALVASKDEVQKLLNLYNMVWKNAKGKVSRVVTISKMSVKEMEKILQSFFGDSVERARAPFGKVEQEGLSIYPLSQGNSLVLIGQEDVVARAEKIVTDTEEQLQDPAEMTVFLYSCLHSNPEDLALVLEKIYASLLLAPSDGIREAEVSYTMQGGPIKTPDGYAPSQPLVVSPPTIKSGPQAVLDAEMGNDHFIPDLKTGNLLMVVRRDALVKIKELLRKLDVPKKMVHIEVLLFEKKYHNQNSFGINMLKIGSTKDKLQMESTLAPRGPGVLQFLIGHNHSKATIPYDFAYSFLMTQEDIQLNAAPSVITVNQTPATISIVEEISINNGAAPMDTNKGIAFEKSFTRAQYGITIVLTPTIHSPDETEVDGKGAVTLQTNITFDTTKNDRDDRPMVDRRHIQNEVRVVDGETIILGGLRRKASRDHDERIPFVGEIPGIGKFFGSTKLSNDSTEMFFFITPKIALDPKEELLVIRREALKKRPGDTPEFLQRVIEAQNKERKKFFANSLQILFGNHE